MMVSPVWHFWPTKNSAVQPYQDTGPQSARALMPKLISPTVALEATASLAYSLIVSSYLAMVSLPTPWLAIKLDNSSASLSVVTAPLAVEGIIACAASPKKRDPSIGFPSSSQ